MVELSPLPGAPAIVKGCLDMGGKLALVISLRQLFDITDVAPQLYTPLLLLRSRSPQIALCVDAVIKIIDVREQDLLPIDDGCSINRCASAMVRLDDKPVVLLSLSNLLLQQERQRLAALAKAEQQRLQVLQEMRQ